MLVAPISALLATLILSLVWFPWQPWLLGNTLQKQKVHFHEEQVTPITMVYDMYMLM